MNSWDRLPEETDRAFAVFSEFLRLPPGRRSMLEAARVCYPSIARKSKEKQGIPGVMNIWARRFRWNDRAAAFDQAQHERELEKIGNIREQIVVDSWNGLLILQRDLLAKVDGAEFREGVALMNSIRDTLKMLAPNIEQAADNRQVGIYIEAWSDDADPPQ